MIVPQYSCTTLRLQCRNVHSYIPGQDPRARTSTAVLVLVLIVRVLPWLSSFCARRNWSVFSKNNEMCKKNFCVWSVYLVLFLARDKGTTTSRIMLTTGNGFSTELKRTSVHVDSFDRQASVVFYFGGNSSSGILTWIAAVYITALQS
jgi:hypothetical protein